jgi:hypothetical protein
VKLFFARASAGSPTSCSRKNRQERRGPPRTGSIIERLLDDSFGPVKRELAPSYLDKPPVRVLHPIVYLVQHFLSPLPLPPRGLEDEVPFPIPSNHSPAQLRPAGGAAGGPLRQGGAVAGALLGCGVVLDEGGDYVALKLFKQPMTFGNPCFWEISRGVSSISMNTVSPPCFW